MIMNNVDGAMDFAILAHDGQKNKYSGEPYIMHVLRVFRKVRDNLYGEDAQMIALLHDVVEDTDVTLSEIGHRFGPVIMTGVDAMTKRAGETNEDYYHRVSVNELARVVKIADLHDNFGRNHLIPDEDTRLRMAKKYSLGIDILANRTGN